MLVEVVYHKRHNLFLNFIINGARRSVIKILEFTKVHNTVSVSVQLSLQKVLLPLCQRSCLRLEE